MIKCLENQGYENTGSVRKMIIYVKKFFDCLKVKNRNEGAPKHKKTTTTTTTL